MLSKLEDRIFIKYQSYAISFVGEFPWQHYVGQGVYIGENIELCLAYEERHCDFRLPDGTVCTFPISAIGIEINSKPTKELGV